MKVALITLDRPVDFEAPDQQPVDIVFVLVVPEHETRAHLDALAALATIFSDPGNRDLLRECQDAGSLEHTMQQLLGDYQAAQNLKHSKSA